MLSRPPCLLSNPTAKILQPHRISNPPTTLSPSPVSIHALPVDPQAIMSILQIKCLAAVFLPCTSLAKLQPQLTPILHFAYSRNWMLPEKKQSHDCAICSFKFMVKNLKWKKNMYVYQMGTKHYPPIWVFVVGYLGDWFHIAPSLLKHHASLPPLYSQLTISPHSQLENKVIR